MAKHHITQQGAGLAQGHRSSTASARSCRSSSTSSSSITKFTARRLGHHRARPDHGVRLLVRLNKQYEAEAHELERRRRAGRAARRSCAATSCSCSSTRLDQSDRAGDPVRAGAHARRDAGGAHRRRPAGRGASSPTSGAASACRACPSSSSTAPTVGSPRAALEVVAAEAARRPDRGHASCSRIASTSGSGTGCCTTTPATRSRESSASSPHANVTMVPYHMGSGAPPSSRSPRSPVRRATPAANESGDASPVERDAAGHYGVGPEGGSPGSADHAHRRGAVAHPRPDPWPDPLVAGAAVGQRRHRSSASWSTTPAVCSWCSSAGGGSRGSSSVASVIAEGMVGNQRGYLAMLNPEIELLAP